MTSPFILTTFKNVLIYKDSELYILEDNAPVYYGVAWSDELLYVLRRNNNLGEVLAVYNKSLEIVREITFEEVFDSHQIAWYENKLYITKTATNQICILDTTKILNKRAKLKIEYLDIGSVREDINHVNGITIVPEARELVICLSNLCGGTYSEWRTYSIDTLELKRTETKCRVGHNYLKGYYTSSRDGTLHTPTDIIYYGSWLRGLSISADNILTSISITVDRSSRSQDFPARVLALDSSGEHIQECIKIADVGQINEVKFLNESGTFWDNVSLESLKKYKSPEIKDNNMTRKLEVGSGNRPLPGYEHLDNDPRCPDLDYCTSMDNIPTPDNTFSEIRSIHSIEHIGWRKGKKTLQEWYRVLDLGGRVHIATPNLKWIMEAYLENGKKWVEDFNRMSQEERKYLAVNGSYCHTLWANFKIFSSGSGEDLHMACYDAFLLTSLMAEVGFKNIVVLHDADSLIVEGTK